MIDVASGTLIERTQFSTGNADEAREFMAGAYGDNQLRVKAPLIEDGVLSVDRLAAPHVNVSDVMSPAELEVAITGLNDEVIFSDITGGRATVDRGGWNDEADLGMVPGDLQLTVSPGEEWVHRSESVANTVVGVSEDLLRDAVVSETKESDARWEPLSSRPLTEWVAPWRHTAHFLQAILANPRIGDAPLVILEAERIMAAVTVSAFPHRVPERQAPEHDGQRDVLRRAVTYIESNPQQAMSVGDIAEAAFASPRTLQVAFRRHLDTTPLAYLREVRMSHAHEDLLASNPLTTTVAAVAAKWGYASPGRFSRLYRERFGELPAVTLNR